MSCLILILDACNENYIDRNLTPFLHSLRETGSYAKIKVTPTFATRVEIFTGNSPFTTDTFVDFVYDPKNSPFRLLKMLKMPISFKKRRMKLRRFLIRFSNLTSGSRVDPLNIPIGLLPYFSLNQSFKEFLLKEKERSKDHFFGILKENGFNAEFVYGEGSTIEEKVKNHLPIGEKEVLILHYMTLDEVGHRHGPNSPEIKESLKSIDKSIRKVFGFLTKYIDFIAIFGDHNMVQIEKNINFWERLGEIDAKLVVDYLVFLNSPMCRFWFKNRMIGRKITKFLASLKEYGKIVTEEDLRGWEIPTDRKYGDIIFWLKKGINISPDFYHSRKIKGMHGYLCDAKTPLIIFHKNKKVKLEEEGRLRDIMPTILDLLNIKHEGMDGRSLRISAE